MENLKNTELIQLNNIVNEIDQEIDNIDKYIENIDNIDKDIENIDNIDNIDNEIENINIDNIDKDIEKLADDIIKIKDRQERKLKQVDLIIRMVQSLNFNVKSIDDITKLTLDRDFLKDKKNQEKLIAFIPELRTCYNSAYLTCLHTNAEKKQKTLGINVLRQILKCNYLKMTPKVISHGYDKTSGKKLVSRIYLIQKLLY